MLLVKKGFPNQETETSKWLKNLYCMKKKSNLLYFFVFSIIGAFTGVNLSCSNYCSLSQIIPSQVIPLSRIPLPHLLLPYLRLPRLHMSRILRPRLPLPRLPMLHILVFLCLVFVCLVFHLTCKKCMQGDPVFNALRMFVVSFSCLF